jgi:hypothetical protein
MAFAHTPRCGSFVDRTDGNKGQQVHLYEKFMIRESINELEMEVKINPRACTKPQNLTLRSFLVGGVVLLWWGRAGAGGLFPRGHHASRFWGPV